MSQPEVVPLFANRAEEMKFEGDMEDLFRLCRHEHRSGGPGAMCICGASSGGSCPCSALRVLKQVITSPHQEHRDKIIELLNW